MIIRRMTIEDYDNVYGLWKTVKGFSIRSVDDSKEGITRFIKRNPDTSIIAEENGEVVGTILCGHDGRRGCFYHVCVREDYRKCGIGKGMVEKAVEGLKREGITKISLISFKKNDAGNQFWQALGWTFQKEVNYYGVVLNEENIVTINKHE